MKVRLERKQSNVGATVFTVAAHPRGLLRLTLVELGVLRAEHSCKHRPCGSVTLFLLVCPRAPLWTPVMSSAVLGLSLGIGPRTVASGLVTVCAPRSGGSVDFC